jgi:hypothetical protein
MKLRMRVKAYVGDIQTAGQGILFNVRDDRGWDYQCSFSRKTVFAFNHDMVILWLLQCKDMRFILLIIE